MKKKKKEDLFFFRKEYVSLVSELSNSRGFAFILILFFLDYNDYLTNYSSSVAGNKDILGISTINSPYAWCINASDTRFNITLNQVSYITGISFQGDSNTGSFIRKFGIRYLQKGSWKAIHDVWYFCHTFAYGRKVLIDCLHDLFFRFCIKTWRSSGNLLN